MSKGLDVYAGEGGHGPGPVGHWPSRLLWSGAALGRAETRSQRATAHTRLQALPVLADGGHARRARPFPERARHDWTPAARGAAVGAGGR